MRQGQQARNCHAGFVQLLENRWLLSAGGLDSSFSGDGKTTVDFSPLSVNIKAMAVQSNGKVVEVGSASDGNLAIARLNADGSLDTTFGTTHSGKIVTDYAGGSDIQGYAVALQSDGRIVIGASRGVLETFDILRFNTDGTFDNTFDGDGIVNVDVGFLKNGHPTALAIQNDGKIVVAGAVRHSSITASGDDFLVVRLNVNGSLDHTFGDVTSPPRAPIVRSGKTSMDFDGDEVASAVAIDTTGNATNNPDFGRIVVVGNQFDLSTGNRKVGLARFNTNGTPDSTFDGDGKRMVSATGGQYTTANSVVIEGTGGIVTAGGFAPDGDPFVNRSFLLMGFTSKGANDMTFGTGGLVKTPFSNVSAEAFGVVNGFAQHIIVGGTAGNKFTLAAYTLDGKLDTAFGSSGKVTTAGFGGAAHRIDALAIGPNRTIVAAGEDAGQTARYFDIGPNVAATAINTTASEQGPGTVTFIVSRDLRLPFATRVFFNIGGSASAPTLFALKNHTNDYALSGMTVPQFVVIGQNPHPFVDIPADQTFVLVTLTPVDDTIAEGTETATFTVAPDALYDIGTPTSATISILDNDQTTRKLAPVADAFVNDGANANKNFGTSTQLAVKTSGPGLTRLAFLKFDLTGITTVNSVQLQLFGNLSSSAQSNLVTQVFSVADTSWSETGITFNNKPTADTTVRARVTITDTTPRTYTLDLTTFIKAQLAAGHKIISLELKDVADSSPFVVFNSREAVANGPQLVIT